MKYLYKLFRLFYCPHYWNIIDTTNVQLVDRWDKLQEEYSERTLQCRRCGDLKVRRG